MKLDLTRLSWKRKIFNVWLSLAGLLVAHSTADAQAVRSEVTASNGVPIVVYSDDFAQRYEYTSPSIKAGDGQISVAAVRKAGVTTPIELSGFFVYTGDWRRYSSAIFKGGDPAKFIVRGRDVGRCFSSRYSRPSCTLSESFAIVLSPVELKAHDDGGTIAVQLRADDTTTVIFQVPVSYFKAVAELSKADIDPPAPTPTPTVTTKPAEHVVAKPPIKSATRSAAPTKRKR
ncbi:hypothetical protein GCM10011380_08660 [Sphingomonas metalli]|uniref:Uncharacterized protein n=1 Tax=Sphingomonas metalli TaxID=1779358 RepID=A0A916SXE5_9SPHN|nr:hypothetical protein [Sphingomonas metalli]GGB21362.1 hypothetical protein GCM10011380_08660 [Sphingomonas metalli]